ncbi:MAG: putative Fimbrial assembly family protein [Candidatus Saccharibacteria bacterium]|nr:putative Fimbrial assembly family protein [Candidatus Saccharibacteria bacterium]
MIQFNLLPDVKLEYIKARRLKRTVMTFSVVSGIAALALTILLFVVVNVFQKQHMNHLTADIKRDSQKLQQTQDLDKVLTIQNQLNNLTPLHEKKAAASRIHTYLAQVTPANTTYAKVEVNMIDSKMSFTGAADSLKTINQFVDTLKFTKYTASSAQEVNAFSEIVLTSFGRDDKGASFEINLKFDPVIFDNTQQISLNVPTITTTRSVTEKPGDLFQPLSNTGGNQ